MSEATPISLVLLDESHDPATQVRVSRKTRDMFFLSLGEAVEACSAFVTSKIDFSNQMADLLDLLSAWVTERKERIKAAHLTLRRDNSVLFVVTQKEVRFDEALSDDLTRLDIDVANNPAFELITLDVLAIPAVSAESATAFLSSGQVYTHA